MLKSDTFYVCGPTLESSFQVLLGWLGVVPEQCVHRHHHSRSTEAALKAMVLHQVTLERYKVQKPHWRPWYFIGLLWKDRKYRSHIEGHGTSSGYSGKIERKYRSRIEGYGTSSYSGNIEKKYRSRIEGHGSSSGYSGNIERKNIFFIFILCLT